MWRVLRRAARLVCVPDQFLLSRGGKRATVVVTAVSKKEVAAAVVVVVVTSVARCGAGGVWCRGGGGGDGDGRGSEDWPNGIGEPDRRRLADSRTMPSRAPHGCALVVFGAVRVFVRPSCLRTSRTKTRTLFHPTNV